MLLLLTEFISGFKKVFHGMVYKSFNIINIVLCGVYAIMSFVLFIIYCGIIGTDKTIRKYYMFGSLKTVKNRSIMHLILNLILFIILAIAAFLSFVSLNNKINPSRNSISSEKKNTSKNESIYKDATNNQMKENEQTKNNDNITSERPLKLLIKGPPK